MKSWACLIYVVVLTVVLGLTFGSEEGGGIGSPTAGDGSTGDCPLQTPTHGEDELIVELKTIVGRCLDRSNSDRKQLWSLNGTEQHRDFFKNLCGGLPAIRECLAVETTKWNNCYNETMAKVFAIIVDLVETTLQKGCPQEGEILEAIAEGYKRQTASDREITDFVSVCMFDSITRLMMVKLSAANLATKIWFVYRELQTFKECFLEKIPKDDSSLAISKELVNEMIDKMKCIHPKHGSILLCKTINSSLIDRASVCPFKTHSQHLAALSMLLERRAYRCFDQHEINDQTLSTITSIESFRLYFKNYCQDRILTKICISETTLAAGICLHDSQFKHFQLLGDYLNIALDVGCIQDGHRLADIYYAAKSLENSSDLQDALLTCLTSTRATRAQSYDDSSRLYHYYQELPVVRQCVVDTVNGEGKFADDTRLLMNEIMSKIKCINAEDGTIVLCNTVANH